MKKNFLLLAFLFGFSFPFSLQALTYRNLDAASLSKAARTAGSVAFKGVVDKIENKEGGLEVSFKVQEVLRGTSPSSQSFTLHFPDDTQRKVINLRYGMRMQPPTFARNETVVLFVTTNIRGEHFLIGGEQGLYRVQKVNGQEYLLNAHNNSNLLNSTPLNETSRMYKLLKYESSTSTQTGIIYEDFKQLLDETDH